MVRDRQVFSEQTVLGVAALGYKLDFLILETTTQAAVTIYLSNTSEDHSDL